MVFLAFAESIQLVPDGTLFIHIGLILLMIWVLNRTFFKPINRVIEAREKHMVHGGEANAILQQAGERESEYTREMLEARSKGYELIEQEHAAAVAAREQQLGAVKAEVETRVVTEKQQLEQQAAEARAAIEQQAEEMAEKISSNILKTA